ncbi:DUF2637 domain-containing protein [Kitasatospora sp. NBC_01250]|uniref:DUF2637 domain-containing protein n=1 Tax=unclassified Kitasatospora TaxID=2633591 RepID=UPI002E1625AA|nr:MULTISPECIES: DUF2637 domain-containing protein [unclassified Kitasatospora]WSJ67578.1 DUF2637 domain-containing protein [Kitasatospora sp. NBC_01302]
MYDPAGEFSLRYAGAPYGVLDDLAVTALYEAGGRYDGDTAPRGPRLGYPTTGGQGTWAPEEIPLPRPRAPLDDAGLHATGADSAELGAPTASHRRRRAQRPVVSWPLAIGEAFGVLTAVLVAAVCVLGGMLSYDPLRDLAQSRVPHGLSHLWPVIVYGPWLVGCLSVLRAALEGRRPAHSWAVVVISSSVATGLCISDACRTFFGVLDIVVAGLPPITAAVSLHQLVRQLTTAHTARRTPRHTVRRASR